MSQWHALHAVCGTIRTGLLGSNWRGFHPRTTWAEMIQASKMHRVSAALAGSLREHDAVPAEGRGHLETLLRLNSKRNERLMVVTERMVRVLQAAGVEPVLLKGVAQLACKLYPSPGLRLMGDLDILVSRDQAQPAMAALEGLGFAMEGTFEEGHHHLPRIRHIEYGVVAEVHIRLEHQADEPIVPVQWLLEHTVTAPLRGVQVQIPDPTLMAAHNIHHSQLNHEGYARKTIELREVLDLAMMQHRFADAIDWREIDRRFQRMNQGPILATYLKYSQALFGQPMPALGSAPRRKALARLRQGIEQPFEQRFVRAEAKRERHRLRRASIHRSGRIVFGVLLIPLFYVRERIKDPRGLLRLVQRETWLRLAQRVAGVFRI
jgi:hypothetical protein